MEKLKTLQKIIMNNEMVDATTIAAKLMSLDRRIEKVPSDGNCLFHSVADQIANHPTQAVPMTHNHLRRSTVAFLREHKATLKVKFWDSLLIKNITR